MSFIDSLVRRKTVEHVMAEVEKNEEGALKKCLSRWDVIAYGVSSTVGAGIFVITGTGALAAGPAVVLSFLVASFCCLCSAFCYAEFAARVPVSGSAYTFTYVCLGEFAAWFVGWNLTLEYAISAAAVARGWSSNFANLMGSNFPDWLNTYDIGFTDVSPLSLLICLLCTGALLVGAKESATLNKIITVMNVSCILFIIILGSTQLDTAYWSQNAYVDICTNSTPGNVSRPALLALMESPRAAACNTTQRFDAAPSDCKGSHSGFVPCGFNGILLGAVKIFFSYIGFDSVTTLAEEVPNPRRDIPFGVIVTLTIAGSLYVGTSLVLTGMQPWYLLDSNTPLSSAFNYVGFDWAATVITVCTVTGLSVTTLCSLFGQPRIFYRMAKDGLLFPIFAQLTRKSQVPLWGTIFSGIVAGLIAFFLDINILADMISMGTLLAFTTVCGGIVILRVESPPHAPSRVLVTLGAFVVLTCALSFSLRFVDEVPLPIIIILAVFTFVPAVYLRFLKQSPVNPQLYSVPWVPIFPLLGIFFNVYLICSNTALSFYRLLVWTAIGVSLYFVYGRSHSKLGNHTYALLNHSE